MASQLVRIDEVGHRTLRELRRQTGETSPVILRKALEEYRRKRFFDAVDKGYAALRADPKAWADELAERAAWDATVGDGLDDE